MSEKDKIIERAVWIHEKTGKKVVATAYSSGRVTINLDDFEKGKSLEGQLESDAKAYAFVTTSVAFCGLTRSDRLESIKLADMCQKVLANHIKDK